MHRVRTTQRWGASFRHAQVAHFALLNQFRHRADRVFDWRVGIHTMLVIKVDTFDTKPLETRFTSAANVIRLAVNVAGFGVVWVTHKTKLRCQDGLIAMAFDGFADQFFVFEWAIHIGGVQQGHSEVERAVNGSDRLAVIAGAVKFGHAHATKAQSGDAQPAVSQFTYFHNGVCSLSCWRVTYVMQKSSSRL